MVSKIWRAIRGNATAWNLRIVQVARHEVLVPFHAIDHQVLELGLDRQCDAATPVGRPDPLSANVELTARLREVGELCGTAILDHVVVGFDGYASLSDTGWRRDLRRQSGLRRRQVRPELVRRRGLRGG